MRSLEAIDHFGATHVGAAVVDRDGAVIGSRGDIDHAFPLASVSKLLTAYAVHLATEESILSLADSVGPPGATVAHLLSHASGLSPTDPASVLAPPATRRIYSNAGFELLGVHLSRRAGFSFADYVSEGCLRPLAMDRTVFDGSPASGATGTVSDLARFAAELLAPNLIARATLDGATSVAFPGLVGVLPGFGRQDPCDWGLGFEIKDAKSPHWTGHCNSPATFGHFGQSGTFVLVDPDAGYGLVCLTDRDFAPWAALAWPSFCDAVHTEVTRA